MEQITVNTPSGHYAVVCGRGFLDRVGATVSGLVENTGVFLLSSPRVWKKWGATVMKGFEGHGGAKHFLFDDGETSKTPRTVEKVCRGLARQGADRGCIVVAVGGGVVGDVAGFVAASYLRGVRLVHVPTTLVAQVDSAIGGKTGVNLPEGKNLVGAFYQPGLVVVDPETLRTLPARQYRAGLYEVIKYGVIGDADLFVALEKNLEPVLHQDAKTLDWVLARCIRAKADVVSRDERETGLREVLNLGHTFAHALESATGYKHLFHGEAVGWGLLAAAELATQLSLLDHKDAARIVRLVLRVAPLPSLPRLSGAKLLKWMRADKKARGGRLRLILPRGIGKVEAKGDVPDEAVVEVLNNLRNLRTQ